MKQQRGLFALLALVTTALACAVPGVTTTAPLPSPTADTRLEIMVAETVSAALVLTQQSAPPTADDTSPTPTVPPEPTFTPTPEADASGSALLKNDDGSHTFNDDLGKYQVIMPMQWVPMRVGEQEFFDAQLLPEASNPAIQRSLSTIQEQDPDLFRLFALDMNEEHIDGGFVTNINFVWDKAEELSLPDDARLQEIAASLPESVEGSQLLNAEVLTTKNDIPYGVITSQIPATTQDGTNIIIRQKLIFFDLPVGSLSITLSTTETWLETVEPSFDALVESFITLE
ncbi:MAG TPA: hypothetical protein PK152_08685 [Anaerolineales bacterium]|nr:hypothetical protein [Anaerolineae bacterium]HRJ55080.1 hypothetical protein [Anaerolineales bacterium]HRK89196.1 hypothetical protein [Anaerolineales bacterium]